MRLYVDLHFCARERQHTCAFGDMSVGELVRLGAGVNEDLGVVSAIVDDVGVIKVQGVLEAHTASVVAVAAEV